MSYTHQHRLIAAFWQLVCNKLDKSYLQTFLCLRVTAVIQIRSQFGDRLPSTRQPVQLLCSSELIIQMLRVLHTQAC